LTLDVIVPEGLVVRGTLAPEQAVPVLLPGRAGQHVVWSVEEPVQAGTHEYQIETHVAPTYRDLTLKSRAAVTFEHGGDEQIATETAVIAVSAKGQYLRHLPAIYQDDDLMGRFLMLFESFLAPIEDQIAQIPFYFDPRFAPPDLLPWLASWLGLVLDENWPEERRRLLIQSAALLYRRRGTRWALGTYLRILTGEEAEIVEHMANDFSLGAEGKLGLGIALGRGNQPHTFSVTLRLPPENERTDRERRRIIGAIIDMEKPAHTTYTLHIEPKGQQETK
jgi:phage tail-like protein